MKEILNILNDKGFNAYIVGGYVRDFIMGKESYDIDICTDANIESIKKIFGKDGKSYDEYFSYHINKYPYNIEITTYRKELEYYNNKPIKLEYAYDLYTDLLRRDFTINTLCMDKNGKIIDLLNANKDIDNKIIKTVGNAYIRFDEDNTRVLRAIRFYCELNFELDSEIISYIIEKPYVIGSLNKIFIKDQLDKIFDSNPKRFFDFIEKYNLKRYFDIDYQYINFNSNIYGLWAQIDSNFTFKKDDRLIINNIRKLVKKGLIDVYDIYIYEEFICKEAAIILDINIDKMIEKLPIHSIIDINVSYNDIKKLVKCDNISKYYKEIEKLIVYSKLNNNKEDIIKYLKGVIK